MEQSFGVCRDPLFVLEIWVVVMVVQPLLVVEERAIETGIQPVSRAQEVVEAVQLQQATAQANAIDIGPVLESQEEV